jgi:hypothetical protein
MGGLVNAVLGEKGVSLPYIATVEGSPVFVPGFVGNILVGAAAALISYGLYGPFANSALISGKNRAAEADSTPPADLTLAALAGAILVGYSGGRWMTVEANNQFNRGGKIVAASIAGHLAGGGKGGVNLTAPTPPEAASVVSLPRILRTEPPREAYNESLEVLRKIRGEAGPEPR